MPDITVDIYDLGNPRARVGKGPIQSAYDVQHDDPLSMCGVFSFKVPCRDPKSAYLQVQLRSVDIHADGVRKFVGIVEEKTRIIPATGSAYYLVSGRSFLAEMDDSTVGFLALSTVTNGPATVLSTNGGGTWTLDTTNGSATTVGAYYGRIVASRLSALVKLQERTREHFIYRPDLSGSVRKLIWVGAAGTVSGFRAIQGGGEAVALESNPYVALITDLEELEDGTELANRLRVFGAGDDYEHTSTNLGASSYSDVGTPGTAGWFTVYADNNYIDYNYSTLTLGYRRRERYVQFPDISPISNTAADMVAAANALAVAGMAYARRYGLPHKFYRLTVAKLPPDLLPGQSIRVLYYEEGAEGEVVHDLNTDLIVLNIATRYGNDGSVLYQLTVATTDRMPGSDTEETVSRIEQAHLYQSHTQPDESKDTLTYIDEFDDTESAELPFWIGAEVARVKQVLLRFTVGPLRSTVLSLAGSSTTTNSGGASTPTSTSGGGSTPTTGTGDHSHPFNILAGTIVDNVGIDAGGGIVNDGGVLRTPSTQFETGGHTHGVTIPGHTHDVSIPGHTHDLTPNISANYGIYEDTGSVIDTTNPTTLTAGCTILINGNAINVADIDAAGVAGWYQIDLTDLAVTGYELVDPETFRPNNVVNIVSFLGASGKLGRVSAQLQIRASIQAVANL